MLPVQKRGGISGVPPKGSWEEGDKHFLGNLFRDCEHKSIFYSEYLSKLFFDTLNKQRDGDSIELLPGKPCKIPYLNGGLFEEENPKYRGLVFPADLFQNLFAFFDQYNFTIYEDDPNDQTVAVDPEMLGHIFENLLEDNKDKGAYYTPKEIVHYMCQESLIEYLATYFEGKGYTVTTATTNDFTLNPEQSLLFPVNEARKGQMMFEPEVATTAPEVAPANEIDRTLIEKLLKKQLDDRDKEAVLRHAAEFHDALDTVKICDPAIGSGAFPMGLLQEIFATKQMLWLFEHGNTTQFPASDVKRGIIQNSIYGVDIEQGAVDIARLRFWLSLIVDEPVPKPLPNLDYKIVVGNSLVSKLGDEIIDIDWSLASTQEQAFRQQYDDILKKILTKISTKQKLFFSPDSTSESKTELALSIREMKIELLIAYLTLMAAATGYEDTPKTASFKDKKIFQQATEAHLKTLGWKKHIKTLERLKTKPAEPLHFFDWNLNFPEVMNAEVAEKVGFDIVIGNPPWGGGIDKDNEILKIKYPSSTSEHIDSFKIFIDLSIRLISQESISILIVPNTVLLQERMKDVRKILLEQQIKIIIDLGEDIFREAIVPSCILMIKKNPPTSDSQLLFCDISNLLQDERKKLLFHLDKSEKLLQHNFKKNQSLEFNKSILDFSTLNSRIIKLGDFHDYFFKDTGIQCQRVKVGKEARTKSDLAKRIFIDHAINDHAVMYWKGRDIDRYTISNYTGRYFRVDFKDMLKPNEKVYYNETVYETSPKLMIRQTADKIIAGFDDKKRWFDGSIIGFVPNPVIDTQYSIFYILGLFNSNFFKWYYQKLVNEEGRVFAQVKLAKVKQLPFRLINFQNFLEKNTHDYFVNIVKQILTLKSENKDTTTLEQEIDVLVYKLYALTYEEVLVIEQEFPLSAAEYAGV
jgi:hypothetical protein